MSVVIEEIRESISFILNKLETIDAKLKQQEKDIKAYLEKSPAILDSNQPIIAGLKSTRTSFELLRDEINELRQLMVDLFEEE